MSLVTAILAQVPTTTEIEEFIGVDQWSVSRFLLATAVVIVAIVLSRVLRHVVERTLGRFPQTSESTTRMVARSAGWLVIVSGTVAALSIIGINLGPAVMLGLVFAIIVFFAGRGLIANFSAGLVLQGSPMFAAGDEIVTPAGTGIVSAVTGRTVVLKTLDGRTIEIPNKIMINYAITNLTATGTRLSTMDVGVAYGTDLKLTKAILVEAANTCEETATEPTAEAIITEFGDNAVNLQIRFWHAPTIIEELRAIDAVAESIDSALAEHGIVIAFPQQTLWWGDRPTTEPVYSQSPRQHPTAQVQARSR